MNTITAAVIQSRVFPEKEDTLRALARQIEALPPVDLITLPEMFNCPYSQDRFRPYAEREGGSTWQACAELARRRRVYLSAGSMPELDQAGHVYNTAYVFDREGRQIAKHRKAHLFDIAVTGGQHFQESATLCPGDGITTFSTEFCTMGLCICYDLRFPELTRLMALEGARVILVPAAFNMTTGPAHWELLFRQRAVDNQVYLVGTAPARDPAASYRSWGHSIVTGPWGNVVMEMEEGAEARVVTIDLGEVERIREELPLLRHRRTDLYALERRDS